MSSKIPKDERVSARISKSDMMILKKLNVNPAEAIHYYCSKLANEKELLLFKKKSLMSKLTELKLDEIVVEQELEKLELRLEQIEPSVEECSVESFEDVKKVWVENSVKIIQDIQLRSGEDIDHLFVNNKVLDVLDRGAVNCGEDIVVFCRDVRLELEKCMTKVYDNSERVFRGENVRHV